MSVSEHAEQVKVVHWLEYTYPNVKFYAVPNGGHRHISVAKKLKAEGVRGGVPDLVIPLPAGGFAGLYVEMKRPGGGRVSPKQREWLDYLNRVGYKAIVCNSFVEARDEIEGYLQCLLKTKKPNPRY